MHPYRNAVHEEESAPKPGGDLARYDVSGLRGADGPHGAPGSDGSGSGQDGRRGGDAGPAQPGQSAGVLRVEARSVGGARVSLGGTLRAASGAQRNIEAELDLARPGDVVLLARGGDGGRGGRGGPGGDGARGRDGSDATRYASGTNGGSGGDGGAGGDGSSGAAGGRGGGIAFVVGEHDTHLALIVTQACNGGAGGPPGAAGRGGSGGAGGRGGSSYSWTETEHYTDSQGNSQTRTTSHSNSGGYDGASGSSGRSGAPGAYAGAPGRAGTFVIEVVSANGQRQHYPRRFDETLRAFTHAPDDADGIYEPGESITVSHVAIENTGAMPTPPNHPTIVRLEKTTWIVPVAGDHLRLDRALAPGERVVLDGALRFHLASYVPHGAGAPLASRETIRLSAFIPAANRAFSGFEASRDEAAASFDIGFPIEIAAIDALHAIAPGEATEIAITIRNVSKKPFGRATDRARRIVCRFRFDRSELGDAHAQAFHDGRRVSLAAGHEIEVDALAPGEARTVSIFVGMAETAPIYRSARVLCSLELGRTTAPDVLGVAQMREHEIRVASRFGADASADALLVVGHRTTREALDAWKLKLVELGLEPATWDVSLEGHLDLGVPAAGGASLAGRFRGRALVVLDAELEAAGGAKLRPSHLLSRADAHAFHAEGGRIVFVGGRNDPRAWLLADGLDDDDDRPEKDGAIADAVADAMSLGVGERGHGRIPTRLRFWGGTPVQGDLVEIAKDAVTVFARCAPARHRALFSFSFAERVVSSFLWVRRFSLGALRAHRLLDRGAGRFVHADAPDASLVDLTWIDAHGPAIGASVLGCEAKIARICRGAEGEATLTSLADDVLVEVAAELHAALARGGSVEDDELPLLDAVARAVPLSTTAEHASVSSSSAGGRELARIAGEVWAMAKGSVRFWEWLPPFVLLSRRPRLRRLARRHVDVLLDRAFGTRGAERDAAEHVATEARRAVERRHETAIAEDAHRGGLGAFAIENAHAAHQRHGLAADESALPGGVAAIEAAEIAKLAKRDARATRARAGALAAQEGARAEKLVAGGLDALRKRAAEVSRSDASPGDVADIVRDGDLVAPR